MEPFCSLKCVIIPIHSLGLVNDHICRVEEDGMDLSDSIMVVDNIVSSKGPVDWET